ncbi:MAG: hypothetical protein EAX96_17335 [Candidatus Lokiarchaeota archaeon]|nr:hypothetical protein [Candidatus Lokiarchaeota archaeon]
MGNTSSKKSVNGARCKAKFQNMKKFVVPSLIIAIIFSLFHTLFVECVQNVNIVLFWVGYGCSALMIVPACMVVVYQLLTKSKSFRNKCHSTNKPNDRGGVWDNFERFLDNNTRTFYRIIPIAILLAGIFLTFNFIYFSNARPLIEFIDWIAYSFIAVIVMTIFSFFILGLSGFVKWSRVVKLVVMVVICFAFVGLFLVPSVMTIPPDASNGVVQDDVLLNFLDEEGGLKDWDEDNATLSSTYQGWFSLGDEEKEKIDKDLLFDFLKDLVYSGFKETRGGKNEIPTMMNAFQVISLLKELSDGEKFLQDNFDLFVEFISVESGFDFAARI